jgi:shikimate kinase
MGSGKSVVGRMFANKFGFQHIDSDQKIIQLTNKSINKIFEEKGEKFFRMEEENEILKSLEKNNCVIALGGGAFMNKTVRENILKNAISIWLNVDIKTLNQRVKWNQKRPLLKEENNQKK